MKAPAAYGFLAGSEAGRFVSVEKCREAEGERIRGNEAVEERVEGSAKSAKTPEITNASNFRVVLGGVGTLVGPAIGAGAFLQMKHFVSSQTEHWLLIVGVIFVGCVMFFRKGVCGMIGGRKDPA